MNIFVQLNLQTQRDIDNMKNKLLKYFIPQKVLFTVLIALVSISAYCTPLHQKIQTYPSTISLHQVVVFNNISAPATINYTEATEIIEDELQDKNSTEKFVYLSNWYNLLSNYHNNLQQLAIGQLKQKNNQRITPPLFVLHQSWKAYIH